MSRVFKMAVPALFVGLLIAVVTGQEDVVTIEPKEAVVRVGDELRILCYVSHAINDCRITIHEKTLIMTPSVSTPEFAYYGSGLGNASQPGQCGVLIKSVKPEYNGDIFCKVPPSTGIDENFAKMNLIVAVAPKAPVLKVTPGNTFTEGDLYEAECEVSDGRPVANITWWLESNQGSEQILNGLEAPVTQTNLLSDTFTIKQKLKRNLQAEDNMKLLTCRSEHLALNMPLNASRQLIVHYPPRRVEMPDAESSTLTIFGLTLGAEGRLNVTLRAEPKPEVEWSVGGNRISVPGNSADGLIVAEDLQRVAIGVYNVTLVIRQLSKEDVARQYQLRASNELGSVDVVLRISTMDEPVGVALDAGAIVGIVIAVLVLVIAVSLVVFAKATDRWCFAGTGNRDNTKSSGESTRAGDVLLTATGAGTAARHSDTESAAGRSRPSRLAALGARMRAALPRAKDKVQATEQPEVEDKLSEDKKAVVYAELALGDQAPAGKPTSPGTEYAEIVYTDQKETKEQ